MLRKRIRHTRRFQEVLNVFLKNGFSHFLFRMGLVERHKNKTSKTERYRNNEQHIAKRLRYALQELGPTFIKLGQIISSRTDLVPKEITVELAKLQDDVEKLPYEVIKGIVESELEGGIEELFQSFNKEPLAAASIGQVHRAILNSGENVAIKVQRPHIKQIIETDLEMLIEVATYLENNTEWAQNYQIKEMIEEFAYSLRNELNYEVEGKNCERIALQFSENPSIHIPKVYWPTSSGKVLTMEMIEGIKVNHIEELDEKGYNRSLITERIVDSMFYQVLEKGFFHGDPHPGNIFILPNNVVCYLDFGMVGQISEELRYHFASLVIHLQQGNSKGMIKTFDEMELLGDGINRVALRLDIEFLQEKYYDVTLVDVSLGQMITELFEVAYKHKVRIPTEITMLGKMILTLEGIVEELDPTFSIMKAVEPFGKKLIQQRLNPKYVLQSSWEEFMENAAIIRNFPKELQSMVTTVKKGKVRLDINVQQLQKILTRLDRISNRLSFSVILLAFSILMVGIIVGSAIMGEANMLWQLPIIEIGFVVATLMFIFLLYTIIRSGKM